MRTYFLALFRARILLLPILFFWQAEDYNRVFAQIKSVRLSFEVYDAATNEPMDRVQIAIEECDCGGITGSDGMFSLFLDTGTYNAFAYSLGYEVESREIELNGPVNVVFYLAEQVEQLSEVVLSAKRITENLESTQMGGIRLQPEELKKIPMAAGEMDVLRAMTLMPGVNNAGEISNGLSIRGGSLDQNLILFDNAPIFNPTHLFGLFSVFTPEMVDQIDLYRANIPARYGGRVTSVMDIKAKSPYVDGTKVDGGVGLVSSRLTLRTPLINDKLYLGVGARAGFTDFLLPLVSDRLENTKARFWDGTMKLLWLVDPKNQFTFTGFYAWDFYQLDLISTIQDVNAANNQYTFQTLNGTLGWTHSFDAQSSLRTHFAVSDYSSGNIFPEVNAANEITYSSGIQFLNFGSEFTHRINDATDYYLGLSGIRYRIAPGNLDPGSGTSINAVDLDREDSYEFGLYGNLNAKLSESFSLSVGLRANHFVLVGPFTQPNFEPNSETIASTTVFEAGAGVKTYNSIEPRIGMNFALGESSAIKASYSRLHQYLQNIFNTTTPLPTSRWKTSDPLIKPQESNSFGLGWYQGLSDDDMEISIEGFYRTTRNNLTYKAGADFFLEPFVQRDVLQGEGRAYGIEFSFRKPLGPFNGWANYTFSRSLLRTQGTAFRERINDNQWYPSEFDRPHVFNGTLNYEGDAYNTWSFNFTLQSGRPYSAPNSVFPFQEIEIPIFIERNNRRLRTYHRLDFSWKVRYSKKLNRRWVGDWTFTIYNLYSRRNPFNLYYTQREGSINGDVFGDAPLGSFELSVLNSPVFALTYNFSFD